MTEASFTPASKQAFSFHDQIHYHIPYQNHDQIHNQNHDQIHNQYYEDL